MRDDNLLIQDIIEAGEKVLRYTEGFAFNSFLDDEKTRDAVVHNFEIIGEASGRLSETGQANFPEVEWRKMKAFRNLLIHQYFGVNWNVVWEVIENFLPQMPSLLRTNNP